METKEKFNVYKDITLRILQKLREGVIPWQRSFRPGCSMRAINHVTGKPYSLLNQMLLGDNGEYITYRQTEGIKDAHVRPGSKGKRISFFSMVEKKHASDDEEETTTTTTETYPCLRYYTVFSIDDCEGITPRRRPTGALPEADAVADRYMKSERIRMRHSDEAPKYDCDKDTVILPGEAAYDHKGDYHADLFRLLVMSTGTEGRLARGIGFAELGPEARAREELTMEMGAAMLLAQCGLDPAEYLEHSTAYIAKWIELLEEDWRVVVTAAARAEKAVKRILGEDKKDASAEACAAA